MTFSVCVWGVRGGNFIYSLYSVFMLDQFSILFPFVRFTFFISFCSQECVLFSMYHCEFFLLWKFFHCLCWIFAPLRLPFSFHQCCYVFSHPFLCISYHSFSLFLIGFPFLFWQESINSVSASSLSCFVSSFVGCCPVSGPFFLLLSSSSFIIIFYFRITKYKPSMSQ